MSVRERTRQRPELLGRLGWKHFTLWTIEVFTDPSGCAEMIAGELGLATDADENGTAGFLDDAWAGGREGRHGPAASGSGTAWSSTGGSRSQRGNEGSAAMTEHDGAHGSDRGDRQETGGGEGTAIPSAAAPYTSDPEPPLEEAEHPESVGRWSPQAGAAGAHERPYGDTVPTRAAHEAERQDGGVPGEEDSPDAAPAAGDTTDGAEATHAAAPGDPAETGGPADAGELRRPRGARRVTVPGTGPAEADEPEQPAAQRPYEPVTRRSAERARERWLKEQRPPHWG
jgi:hypothetical protein